MTLWLLASSLGLGYRPGDAIRQEVSAIDLGARTGWHTKGSINVREDGRISLTRDGVGLVWKSVEVDVDQFPVMLVRVAQSIRRERWTVAVERNDSPSLDRTKWTRLPPAFSAYVGRAGFSPQTAGVWFGAHAEKILDIASRDPADNLRK